MLKWKDESSYSKNDKERIPNVLSTKIEGFNIKIHRHIHYPDTWLLSCYKLDIEKKDLYTNDFNEATKKAIQYIISKLEDHLKLYNKLLDIDSKL